MIRSSSRALSTSLARRAAVLRRQSNVPAAFPTQIFRCFSSEPPKQPTTGSNNEVAPLSSDNLPAKLIDFQVSSKIEGEESHVAIVDLAPGETLRAEAGNMLFMTDGVVMDTNLSGASNAFSRMMTGQNMFLTDFKYEGTEGTGTIGLGTDFPSKIMRFSLEDFDGHSLICQRGAYLASNPTVNIEMEFTKTLTSGFFGGQGFVLQRLTGQGDVLVKGGGTIVAKDLEEGQTIRVTSGSIVCFEPTVQYDVQMMQGVKNAMFGGEGLFVTILQGPGRVWLQGMPADRMIAEIARRVPAGGPGIGIPIGGGGGTAAGEAAGGEEGAAEASAMGADEAVAGGGGEAVAATDAAVEADRQATVASSGATSPSDIDSESQSALFGDAVSDSGDQGSSSSNSNDSQTTDEFASSSTSTTDETTFTDSHDSFETDSRETTFQNEEFFDDQGFPDDTTTTDGLDDAGDAAGEDGASSILSTLWDLFTGGGDE